MTTAVDLVAEFEGLSFTAYRDLTGRWTIGYGHTGGVSEGDTVTLDEARWLLMQDLTICANAVRADASPATDNQATAMESLAYNIGVSAFRGSSVLRLHKLGDFPAAADAFLLWNKAHVNGQLVVVNGLTRRRQREREIYLTP